MHEGTASAGGTPWVCRHFTLRAAAFLRGCASGARTPRCAWRSSVCAPDDNPREPDRSRSLAPSTPRPAHSAHRHTCAGVETAIGRVHRRPRRGPKKKRRPQDAVHCMRPQCPPDDARQAATRPQARAPSVAEAARAEPQSEARGTTTRAASQRGRVAPRPLRSESRRAYFFSGSLPGGVAGLNGNELNMVFAWFCICSCICTNMFFDCSM